MHLTFSGLILSAAIAIATAGPNVDFKGDCSYDITIDNEVWFSSSDTFIHIAGEKLSCQDDTLVVKRTSSSKGVDEFGSFVAQSHAWSKKSENETLIATEARVYDQLIIFSQKFPNGINASSAGDSGKVSTAFPSIDVRKSRNISESARGYAQFQGGMCASGTHIGRWDESSSEIGSGLENSGPIAVFSTKQGVVISAASQFMSASQEFKGGVLSFGVMGGVQSIPAGFEMEFIFQSAPDQGVNGAMQTWGKSLLDRYGKKRSVANNDLTTNYLGYSTDNGAFYYYYTEQGKTYQDTMSDIKAYSTKVGLPYRHWLMDSWWYYKSANGAVKNWTARPDIFPNGADYVYNETEWPVVGHNRYWSSETDYAKQNGGDYDFIIEKDSHGGMSMPVDQQFWDDLMSSSRKWGLKTYEQDWLYNEFSWMKAPLESATLARDWLMQMGTAAERNGLTVQYCMSWPRHILQSVELPAVTQARASGDYHPDNDQWVMGLSSILAHALAIKPTKDNFWSTDKECCGKYGEGTVERYNRLQAAVSTLSTGPVAPSDAINASDVPLIMKSCAKDGKLLQPDRPATRTDASIAQEAGIAPGPKGEVWSTQVTLSGAQFGLLLAAQSEEYAMQPDEIFSTASASASASASAAAAAASTWVALEANATISDPPVVVDESHPLQLPKTDKHTFVLWSLSPVLPNGWALLGEREKWVPVSNDRLQNLRYAYNDDTAENRVSVEIVGTSGETVTVSFWEHTKQKLVSVDCVLALSGRALAKVTSAGKYTCDTI